MHDLPSLAHLEGHENALIRIKNRSEPIGANRFFSYFTQKDVLATIVHLFEGLELSVEEKP